MMAFRRNFSDSRILQLQNRSSVSRNSPTKEKNESSIEHPSCLETCWIRLIKRLYAIFKLFRSLSCNVLLVKENSCTIKSLFSSLLTLFCMTGTVRETQCIKISNLYIVLKLAGFSGFISVIFSSQLLCLSLQKQSEYDCA